MEELKRNDSLKRRSKKKKPIVVPPPNIDENGEKPDACLSKKKTKKKKKEVPPQVNFASFSETSNDLKQTEIYESQRYVLGHFDSVGNCFLKPKDLEKLVLYNGKFNQRSACCEFDVGIKTQNYVLADFDNQGNWHMKKVETTPKEGLKLQMGNYDNGLDKYDNILPHRFDGGRNPSDCSNMVSDKSITKLNEMCARFTYTGAASGNVTKRRRGDGKRDVAGKISGQTESTQVSLEEGVKYQMDSCHNCVDKHNNIRQHQIVEVKTLSDCSNVKSERSINNLHEMFSRFAYTGGAYGNSTNRRRWDRLIEDDVNAKGSEDSQIPQPCSRSCGLDDENIRRETENFRKCESCSSSLSSIGNGFSSCIKLTNNDSHASFSLLSDKMKCQRRIDKVTGRGTSQKQSSISKARKKRSKEFRVVSPYFLNQRRESQALVVAKSERTVHDRGIFPIPEGGEMQVNIPEAKANTAVQVGEDIRDGQRAVLKNLKVSVQKGFCKSNCPTIRNEVRIVSRYFAVSESSEENIVINRKPSKSKSGRKRKTLTAAEKWDEAYRKRTPDNTWKPPRSPFHLLQEDHSFDPWRVLVVCILLNVTTGLQVRKVLEKFFAVCPNAKVATEVDVEDIAKVTKSLGLSKKRSLIIQRFSREYLEDTWTYVTQLYGVGKYAADAYAAFINGKWDRIVPTDHMLNRYWDFLQSLENGYLP